MQLTIGLNMPTNMAQTIEIDYEKCDGCGICVDFCPVGVFTMEKGALKVSKLSACYVCDTCVDLCPQSAINVIEATASGTDIPTGRRELTKDSRKTHDVSRRF